MYFGFVAVMFSHNVTNSGCTRGKVCSQRLPHFLFSYFLYCAACTTHSDGHSHGLCVWF